MWTTFQKCLNCAAVKFWCKSPQSSIAASWWSRHPPLSWLVQGVLLNVTKQPWAPPCRPKEVPFEEGPPRRVFKEMQPLDATLSDTDPQSIVPVLAETAAANHQVVQQCSRGKCATLVVNWHHPWQRGKPCLCDSRVNENCLQLKLVLQEFWETEDLTNHVGMCPRLQPHKCHLCSNVFKLDLNARPQRHARRGTRNKVPFVRAQSRWWVIRFVKTHNALSHL